MHACTPYPSSLESIVLLYLNQKICHSFNSSPAHLSPSLFFLLLLPPHGSPTSPTPHIATPSHHPLHRSCWRINGRSDIEVENRLAGRFGRGGVVVNHVADFFGSRSGILRVVAGDVPVVAVEGGFSPKRARELVCDERRWFYGVCHTQTCSATPTPTPVKCQPWASYPSVYPET